MKNVTLNFIGIGAAKCGTTWLHHSLGHHPDICMPSPQKELLFYDYNFRDERYLADQFQHRERGQICGEFSPSYFIGKCVPERIFQRDSGAKFIVCVRNPVDRAYSHYCMHYKGGTVSASPEDEIVPGNRLFDDSCYRANIERFLEFFPDERFHIIKQEDMRVDPDTTLANLFGFLGVNREFTNPYAKKEIHSKGKAIRHKGMYQLLTNLARLGRKNKLTAQLINRLYVGGVGSLYKKLDGGSNFPDLSNDFKQELKQKFSPDVLFLREKFGVDTTSWE